MEGSKWARALAIYNCTGFWNEELGPEPGHRGCEVPESILMDVYGLGKEGLVALFGSPKSTDAEDTRDDVTADVAAFSRKAVDGDIQREPVGVAATDDDSQRGSFQAQRAGERARQFLRTQLANGPRSAVEMSRLAEAAGVRKRTLDRARQALGITAYKDGYGGPWIWRLPKLHEINLAGAVNVKTVVK